jgi:hypothetical protein
LWARCALLLWKGWESASDALIETGGDERQNGRVISMPELIALAINLSTSPHLNPRQVIPAFKALVHELFVQQNGRKVSRGVQPSSDEQV